MKKKEEFKESDDDELVFEDAPPIKPNLKTTILNKKQSFEQKFGSFLRLEPILEKRVKPDY